MRLLVTGSRTITDHKIIADKLKDIMNHYCIKEVFVGDARGVDYITQICCYCLEIPCRIFEANWKKYGRSAGIIRNEEMIELLQKKDIGIAFWDGFSKGTKHCIEELKKVGKLLEIIKFR